MQRRRGSLRHSHAAFQARHAGCRCRCAAWRRRAWTRSRGCGCSPPSGRRHGSCHTSSTRRSTRREHSSRRCARVHAEHGWGLEFGPQSSPFQANRLSFGDVSGEVVGASALPSAPWRGRGLERVAVAGRGVLGHGQRGHRLPREHHAAGRLPEPSTRVSQPSSSVSQLYEPSVTRYHGWTHP